MNKCWMIFNLKHNASFSKKEIKMRKHADKQDDNIFPPSLLIQSQKIPINSLTFHSFDSEPERNTN